MNSLIIKGADFSSAKVGKLNIQKINIVQAGVGSMQWKNNQLTVVTSGLMDRAKEYAYSEPVLIPDGVKRIFGKINAVFTNANIESILSSGNAKNINQAIPWMVFELPENNNWTDIVKFQNSTAVLDTLGYTDHLYDEDGYGCVLVEGAVYGGVMGRPGDGTSHAIFNWVRNDALVSPMVGLDVPELYWGF